MGGRTTSLGRRALAAPLSAAGGALAFTGRLDAAQWCLFRAARVLGADRALTSVRASTLNRLGVVEKTAGRYDVAAAHYAAAAALFDDAGGQPLIFEAAMEHNLAGLLLARGAAFAAEGHARRAMDARRHAGGSETDIACDQLVVAATLAAQGRSDEARIEFCDALSVLEPALGANHYEVGSALVGLGALEQRDDPRTAEQHYKRALAIKQRTRCPGHPEVGIIHNNLGTLYRAQGRDDLALEHFQTAARLLRRYGPSHPAALACKRNVDELLARNPDAGAAQ